MNDEITLAFGHPSERAKALAGDPPPDRIAMTDHRREVEIGAFQAERGVTQTVQFDVVVEVATRAEQAVDDVDRILSYDTIVEAIDAALTAERVNLLETLAARIRWPPAASCGSASLIVAPMCWGWRFCATRLRGANGCSCLRMRPVRALSFLRRRPSRARICP